MAETVSVSILDKSYQVSCEPHEIDSLQESARYLDTKMREIKDASTVLGLDRVAVMAALNIANDLIVERGTIADAEANKNSSLQQLDGKLSNALNRLKSVASNAY